MPRFRKPMSAEPDKAAGMAVAGHRQAQDASASEVKRQTTGGDDERASPGEADADPRPPAVTFVTTEHFVLQGARAATISESTGRASMFLAAVSGGLVALGLVATATSVGTAFYAFGLVLLPTLSFVGLVTFERALQSAIEDLGYARRIALLRGYYFDNAPELTPYLLSVPVSDRLRAQGLSGARWQEFRTVAGMVGVITAVLAGSTASLAAILISDHSLAAALIAGAVVALAALVSLMQFEGSAWSQALTTPFTVEDKGPS
jgi:hypothetical protein